ncbi:regulatory signaling modulator protein AmpE [uncultured Pseudoteredinibacter sp.]|uniref:regulatory signaling modulator protein AmpE n=1 Tax=uncultured Pseudoteredinibacter sp. TaxID=1641701 RepID=UPI00261C9938|nr:regulatory signaling modulator protein AmpE [uncultured Pseudoteredinibacter sp.]
MQLTVLLIALICVRWFGTPSWLHLDQWVKPWLDAIAGKSLRNKPWLYWLIAALVPLAIAAYALQWSAHQSGFLEFIVTAFILLYSIGRDDFKAQVQGFIAAVKGADNDAIKAAARELQASPADEELADDKAELYHQTLLNAAYRAMERVFVVFFWFAMLGPLAALAYRILRIFYSEYQARQEALNAQQASIAAEQASSVEGNSGEQKLEGSEQEAQELEAASQSQSSSQAMEETKDGDFIIDAKPLNKLLWLLEWPVVRVLGLSFAITGNFMSCMQRWRDSLLCFKTPSKKVLGNAIGGALDIDVEKLDCEAICCEMETLQSLFYRTGLFWLCALAVYLMLAL